MEPPTLSVVAPVYNEAGILSEFVARCTRAAEQCGRPFEVVLVDDASTDGTPGQLASLARWQSAHANFSATAAPQRPGNGYAWLGNPG